LLRGLGEGVEEGRLGTGRDEKLARAFWGGAEEDGSFYFGEICSVIMSMREEG